MLRSFLHINANICIYHWFSTRYFLSEPFVEFRDMFVVRRLVEQAAAGSILPLGMLANAARVDA